MIKDKVGGYRSELYFLVSFQLECCLIFFSRARIGFILLRIKNEPSLYLVLSGSFE